jgi:hypothetical protein
LSIHLFGRLFLFSVEVVLVLVETVVEVDASVVSSDVDSLVGETSIVTGTSLTGWLNTMEVERAFEVVVIVVVFLGFLVLFVVNVNLFIAGAWAVAGGGLVCPRDTSNSSIKRQNVNIARLATSFMFLVIEMSLFTPNWSLFI